MKVKNINVGYITFHSVIYKHILTIINLFYSINITLNNMVIFNKIKY